MSIIIRDLNYVHSDKEALFQQLNLTINSGEKIALTGNNGCGKSTLMRIIAGEILPTEGTVTRSEHIYYVPQHFGQYNNMSIAQALKIDHKQEALHAILKGNVDDEKFSTLDDDWTIEERAQSALNTWGMGDFSLSQLMNELSGGEKTRVFLAGIELHSPTIVLMDEPTNHLDASGRKKVYNYIKHTSATLLVISHDRKLLNLLSAICELSANALTHYGGNYDFYREQKEFRMKALQNQLEEKQKALRLARKTAREVAEQKAKQNTRGEKAAIKKGIPRIVMGGMKDKAEASTSKQKNTHEEKSEKLQQEMRSIRNNINSTEKLKTNFNPSSLHNGKTMFTAKDLNFKYPNTKLPIWDDSIQLEIRSGERLCIEGDNGSGKTTLLKLICGISPMKNEIGEFATYTGVIERIDFCYIYLDQEYSLIKNELSILEQAELFNHRLLPEHELKTILNRYLFPAFTWSKPCSLLSGGEKMRLAFCCLMIEDNTPDVFVLDEPTNNLDIESIDIIAATIRDYSGTIVAVSHDEDFLRDINCTQKLYLTSKHGQQQQL